MQKDFYPSEIRHAVSRYISDNSAALSESAGNIDQILDRFQEKYKHIEKQTSVATYIYIGISALYFLKALSIGLDVKFLDQKVLEIPHAYFAYAALSNLILIFALTRSIDALYYSSFLQHICKQKWGQGSDLIYRSYIGEDSWLGNFYSLSTAGYHKTKFLSVSSVLYIIFVGVLIQIPLLISPIAIGIIFLL